MMNSVITNTNTNNGFFVRENSKRQSQQSGQSYDDGSFYSDTNSTQSHHDSYYEDEQNLENDFNERSHGFIMDQRNINFGDIFEGGSSDYCSTCPSDDYYTDSFSDSE